MFEIPNLNMTLKKEEIEKLVLEAEKEVKAGRNIEELFEIYREKYTIHEAFMILMQVRLRGLIDPEFHNFTGKIRHR